MAQSCILHDHAISQYERTLKLPCSYATMQKFPFGIVGLASADDELIVFRHDFEVFAGKTGHRISARASRELIRPEEERPCATRFA